MHPKEVIDQMQDLVTLPEVVTRINELVEDPNSTTLDLEQVVETDPVLSAKLLKIANSALYGYTSQIDTIKRAIMVVGTNGIRDIAWATAAVATLSACNPPFADIRSFWRHSLYVATVARILAGKCRILRKDRFFTAGLLHDIGRLIYYSEFPVESQKIVDTVEDTGEAISDIEKRICGFTHSELGECLLSSWGLPDSIQATARFHHEPDASQEYRLDVAIIHIANSISHQAGVFCSSHDVEQNVHASAWHTTGLSDKIVESVIRLADEQYQEAVNIFLADLELASAA